MYTDAAVKIFMRVLFLGDIVGKPGRKVVKSILPQIIAAKKPDFIIANGENIAGGVGTNRKTINDLIPLGIQCFTGGNHTFDNDTGKELFSDSSAPVLRPANFPEQTPGKGWMILTNKNNQRLLIVSLLGRIFMTQQVNCPFRTLTTILNSIDRKSYDACLIDIHAEATSEKQALRWAFDGKVSAVIGTHTHVQTADPEISPAGTAFMADAGMCGSLDSCLGVRKEEIIERMITQMPTTNKLETKGRMQLNGVIIDVDSFKQATHIELIRKISS